MNPKPYVPDLENLRRMVESPQIDFKSIQNAFLDMRDRHPSFERDAVKLTGLPHDLKAMVEEAMRQRGRQFKNLTSALFLGHPDDNLIEGAAVYGSGASVMSLLYFTDLKIGMLTFSSFSTDMVEFIRISSRPEAEGKGLSGLN